MIGTWPDDHETLLALRGLSIRLRDLNGVLGWALFRDGSFDLEEAMQIVRGAMPRKGGRPRAQQ